MTILYKMFSENESFSVDHVIDLLESGYVAVFTGTMSIATKSIAMVENKFDKKQLSKFLQGFTMLSNNYYYYLYNADYYSNTQIVENLENSINLVESIKSILIQAAKSKSTVAYPKIISLFEKDTAKSIIWSLFEVACEKIADSKTAVYGALMAKKDSGLPSDGFFDIFRNCRLNKPDGFILPNIEEFDDSEQKEMMVEFERARVYSHVANLHI